MSESRAADYIAFGLNRGVDRFLESIEKRKEEEKLRAREFKALAEFADASGMLSKDQATVMDRDSLKGFVQGKMYQNELQQKQSLHAFQQYAQLQRMQADSAMTGMVGEYNDQLNRNPNLGNYYENPEQYPAGRPEINSGTNYPLEAFQSALSKYPQAATDERFSAFANMVHQQAPKEYVPTEMSKLLKEKSDAIKAGRTSDASDIQAKIDKEKMPTGTTMIHHPDGTIEFIVGPTGAIKTDSAKAQVNAEQTFATIDHILANQQNSDWGVRGLIGKVQDEWLAQFVPGLADPRRIDVQASISQLRQQMMAALKAETQISQKDKEELLASAPKVGAGESPTSGLQKIQTFRDRIGERLRAYAVQTGSSPPIYAMTVEQIADAVNSGKMTQIQGVEAVRKYHPSRLR